MEKDLKLLQKVYTGTNIGSVSLNAMLPGVKSPSMRRAIITQINEYDKINSDAKSEISNLGKKPQKPVWASACASMEAKTNVKINDSASHVAEVIIKGSNMGIINITKEINKSHFCKPSTYNLARRLLKTEEQNVERLKEYL